MSTEHICEWILAAQARSGGTGVLAFDADGTLWSGDVAEDFVHEATASGWFRTDAQPALSHELLQLGETPEATASECLAKLFRAYVEGRYPSDAICEAIAWASAGYTEIEAQARASVALRATGLRERVRPEMREVIAAACAANIPMYIISASPTYVVRAALEVAELKVQGVIGVEAEQDADGQILPRPVRPIPHGPGKVSGLRALVGPRPLLAAFGDNWLDAHLLRESALPIAVYPKQKLLDVADQIPGLRLLSNLV